MSSGKAADVAAALKKTLPAECCGKCFFAASSEGQVEGAELICRRHPPTGQMMMVQVAPSVRNPQGGMTQAVGSIWPPVQPAQWCGEYQAKTLGKPD